MIRKILFLALTSVILASEFSLIAITHKSCPVCQAWHDEVVPYYDLEAKKQRLPKLSQYDISDNDSRQWVRQNIGGIAALPTFVIVEGGEVKQKFEGYSDYRDFFISLNKAIIQELKKTAAKSVDTK
ncbi:MAG: hypothetical protein VXW87_04745 [Pseudomonadota bacterium]|nr:hypothetical protein [Pseudomonadota bacterium]